MKDGMGIGEGFPDELAHRMWPDGPTPRERSAWLSMTAQKREKAVRRARAIDQVLSSQASAKEAATEAGVSLPQFYALIRAWKDTGSLLDIVPHVSGRASGENRTPPEVVRLVGNLVREHPETTQENLAKAIVSKMSRAVSLSKARQLVADEKVRQRRMKLGGKSGYGQHLLVDRSAIGLKVERDTETLDYVVVAAIVDYATGSILGHAVGTSRFGGDGLQRQAVQSAITNLSASGLTPTGNETPKIMTVPNNIDPFYRLAEIGRLKGLGEEFELIEERGERGVGVELKRLLSGNIERMRLLPSLTFAVSAGSPANNSLDDPPPLALDEAREVIDSGIEAHNATIAETIGIPTAFPSTLPERLTALAQAWS